MRRATYQDKFFVSPAKNFYPRSPCGERRYLGARKSCYVCYFYPRSPCGERRHYPMGGHEEPFNFYPRSPCGERRKSNKLAGQKLVFLSTLSLRRATSPASITPAASRNFYPRSPCGERLSARREARESIDFYPRSPCGERQARRASRQQPAGISIHALLAESDNRPRRAGERAGNFYPRSPCGERRSPCPSHSRRAPHFYPRSPCGERPRPQRADPQRLQISIHALLAESDRRLVVLRIVRGHFYPRSPCGERPHASHPGAASLAFLSTLSLRRATVKKAITFYPPVISIHALLAESDSKSDTATGFPLSFLSTLSLRRATTSHPSPWKENCISIHALLAESDLNQIPPRGFHYHFYPRSPCGERLNGIGLIVHISGFLSTLSLRRATTDGLFFCAGGRDFYPRSPCGERQLDRAAPLTCRAISIHALLAESDPSDR